MRTGFRSLKLALTLGLGGVLLTAQDHVSAQDLNLNEVKVVAGETTNGTNGTAGTDGTDRADGGADGGRGGGRGADGTIDRTGRGNASAGGCFEYNSSSGAS